MNQKEEEKPHPEDQKPNNPTDPNVLPPVPPIKPKK
jgi:hypothetical protein